MVFVVMVALGLFWLVVVAVIVAMVAWAVAQSGSPRMYPFGIRRESPLEILQCRLARGEITREQYWDIRQDLERGIGALDGNA